MYNKPFLLNEYEISRWAFWRCKYAEDDPEIRNLITHPYYSYLYCKNIKDRPEIRKNITESLPAYLYCSYVSKGDKRLFELAKSWKKDIQMSDKPILLDEYEISNWALEYCRNTKDDPEIRDLITDPYCAAEYCENISKKDERLLQIAINWAENGVVKLMKEGRSTRIARELIIELKSGESIK